MIDHTELQGLKARIENLDPAIHGALRRALTSEYCRLTGEQIFSAGSQNRLHLDEISTDSISDIFRRAIEKVSERYVSGTIDFVLNRYPQLYQEISGLESKLDEIWTSKMGEDEKLAGFKVVLKRWYLLQLRSIKLYNEENKEGATVD